MSQSFLKVIYSFSFFLTISLIAGAQEKISLSGNFTNTDAEEITLKMDTLFVGNSAWTETAKMKNGSFSITAEVSSPILASLSWSDQSLAVYMHPGDEIKVNEKEGSFVYSGNRTDENSLLQGFFKEFEGKYSVEGMKESMLNNSADMFELEIYDNRRKQKDFVERALEAGEFDEDFESFMRNMVDYTYLNLLAAYPFVRSENNESGELQNLPGIMEEEFSAGTFARAHSLQNPAVRDYLWYASRYKAIAGNDFSFYGDPADYIEAVHKTIEPFTRREDYGYIMGKMLWDDAQKGDQQKVKRMISILKGKNPVVGEMVYRRHADWLEQEIKEEKPDKKNMAESKPIDKMFAMTDEKGNAVSMADFRGKVIYVDFWATWCGPCRRQFPFSKKLHQSFSKSELKDVVFLYVSLDESRSKWENAIEKMGLEGEMVHLQNSWKSEGARHYKITSIPRYMLIDKEGNVVNANAKRPSMPGIKDDILKLIYE